MQPTAAACEKRSWIGEQRTVHMEGREDHPPGLSDAEKGVRLSAEVRSSLDNSYILLEDGSDTRTHRQGPAAQSDAPELLAQCWSLCCLHGLFVNSDLSFATYYAEAEADQFNLFVCGLEAETCTDEPYRAERLAGDRRHQQRRDSCCLVERRFGVEEEDCRWLCSGSSGCAVDQRSFWDDSKWRAGGDCWRMQFHPLQLGET
ncbi:hypothetical protein EYF80_005440 [Liparis tanakae]|uniref:Uncharacterized protein n=1 Tax=Liparis tanakae TaxID=230148 RepID=A0A4Z2J358_9TELE|nr:hypothetical protein EYF80_005440 [Liparis tanakae]